MKTMFAGLPSMLLLMPVALAAPDARSSRVELWADSNWKFLLGDPPGAQDSSFSDAPWRTVDLPHDWSIESPPDRASSTGPGGGYFPAGAGWYRKTFRAPSAWKGKRVSVEFDGVYRNATVYLNGRELGTHPYGYTSFCFDLTPGLDFEKPNVVAVRVDNSTQPSSRWYAGSGIYRHVRLVVTEPVHVAHWGVFVTTPEVSEHAAKVSVQVQVENDSIADAALAVETLLFDHTGKVAGRAQSKAAVADSRHGQRRQPGRFALPGRSPQAAPRPGAGSSPNPEEDRRDPAHRRGARTGLCELDA